MRTLLGCRLVLGAVNLDEPNSRDEVRTHARLAVDATAARVGGGVSRVNELTASFSVLAPNVHYVLAIRPSVRAELKVAPPRVSYIQVPSAFNPGVFRATWEHLCLPSLLARSSPDWVLSPFNVLPLGRQLRHTPKAVIVSSVAPFHPRLIEALSIAQKARVRLLRELTFRSIDVADHIFLLSHDARRLLAGHLGGKAVTYLPMSRPRAETIEAARRMELPVEARQGRYFVVPGDVWRYRAAHEAIDALLRLERSGVDARLLVCGGPLDAEYVNELRALGERSQGSRVAFLGPRTHGEMLALMRGSVATIVCSRVENPGRLPVEAMAMGSPVIAVNLPSSWDSCGSAARYYEPGDVDDLSTAMVEFLESQTAREARIQAGHEQLADRGPLKATRTLLTTLGMLDPNTPCSQALTV